MSQKAESIGRVRGGGELLRLTQTLDAEACAAAADETGKAQWLHVLPSGPEVEARDGRKFSLSSLEEIVRRTELPMLIDWEHASESGDTRAAGWLEELKVEPPSAGTKAGIWGRVSWTPKGREDASQRFYRFLSPVVLGKRANDARGQFQVQRLSSVALTNKPALHMTGIELLREQLSHRYGPITEDDSMTPLKMLLCTTFGLPADASDEQVVQTATTVKQTSSDTASLKQIAETLTRERNEAQEQLTAAKAELSTFRAGAFKTDVEAFFAEGARAGKIPPAARDKWLSFAMESSDKFSMFKDVVYPGLPVTLEGRAPSSKPAKASLKSGNAHGVDVAALKSLGFTDEQITESCSEVFAKRSKVGPGDDDDDDDDDEDSDSPPAGGGADSGKGATT